MLQPNTELWNEILDDLHHERLTDDLLKSRIDLYLQMDIAITYDNMNELMITYAMHYKNLALCSFLLYDANYRNPPNFGKRIIKSVLRGLENLIRRIENNIGFITDFIVLFTESPFSKILHGSF